MPAIQRKVTPGPIEIFDSLGKYGAGANYDAYIARGPRGWAAYSPDARVDTDPTPRRFRYLLGRKIAQPRAVDGRALPGGHDLGTTERAARIEAELVLLFVLLNPSTATEQDNDPTITRCEGYALDWGYTHLWIANVFAYRSTDPYAMIKAQKRGEDVIGPLNDAAIRAAAAHADAVVCGWGNHGRLGDRSSKVRKMLEDDLRTPHVLKLNHKTEEPVHPLYQPRALTPRPWWLAERE